MNRYVAVGMMIDALDRKTILVLTRSGEVIRHAMDEVRRILPDDPDSFEMRRTNGAEEISFPTGGRILFRSVQANHRGMSADVVYLDDDADWELTPARLQDLHRVTRSGGEIIRA